MNEESSPNALAELVATVDAAVLDLSMMRCTDPATREALRVVKLTAHTLRSFWLPTLDAVADQRS
jgi:uncharacterized cysteine cluster protein YcgN (CxxCxxCC family)